MEPRPRPLTATPGSYEPDPDKKFGRQWRAVRNNLPETVPYLYRARVYPQAAANVRASIAEHGTPLIQRQAGTSRYDVA